jgi:hypothetical protein
LVIMTLAEKDDQGSGARGHDSGESNAKGRTTAFAGEPPPVTVRAADRNESNQLFRPIAGRPSARPSLADYSARDDSHRSFSGCHAARTIECWGDDDG